MWDETKAAANVRKHGVPFELALTVFKDPQLLTVADLEHSDIEDRWFSIGCASNGAMLLVVYLWSDVDPAARARSRARRSTSARRMASVLVSWARLATSPANLSTPTFLIFSAMVESCLYSTTLP